MENITVIATGDKITKTNKPYKSLTVRQENGTEHKVNIWSDFPNFANVQVGTVIRGKIEPNGKYTNLISELQANKPISQGGAFKTAQIEKAQENKAAYIAKAQDNKESSIKTASTMRMAVDLAIAERSNGHQSLDNTFEESIRKWREWCWSEWDMDIKSASPFND